MMSQDNNENDTHPIHRMQNLRKPQLDKLSHPLGGAGDNYLESQQQGYGDHELHLNGHARMHNRKRDNAHLAPLNYPLNRISN